MNKKQYLPLVDQTLTIKAPISQVFAFLANHENYASWYPKVISIESANELPHGTVGKVYREAIRLPTGRDGLIAIKVVESRQPELFVTEGVFAPLHPRMEVHLSAESENETSLHWKFFSRSQSVIGRFLIRLLVKKALERDSKTGLTQMKALVENRD
ncbi:SRPBCC family protein [Parasphingorhabdus sp.]|uniref:SRPBCC family protein n=1 Tax=Parasphingorhabdus sp. TaxID=2709688 RepID=UPI003A90E35E